MFGKGLLLVLMLEVSLEGFYPKDTKPFCVIRAVCMGEKASQCDIVISYRPGEKKACVDLEKVGNCSLFYIAGEK